MHGGFQNVSILLPIMDETSSIVKTVDIANQKNAKNILEFLFIYGEKTRPETLELCKKYSDKEPDRYRLIRQRLPYLGGAFRSGFSEAKGSHVLMMCSDLETDPATVAALITKAKLFPKAIITATRWHPEGGFEGYHSIKFYLNATFQKVFKILYSSSLSDPTFGYRLFPREVLGFSWRETRQAFVLETLLRPLRRGISVVEVPTKWKARIEGKSHNPFFANFQYLTVLLKGLFYSV